MCRIDKIAFSGGSKRSFSMLIFIVMFFMNYRVFSAVTSTTTSGNWNTGGNWNNGVPGSGDDANINHDMTINTNISTTKGDYIFNNPSIDLPGGPAYNLSLSGTGSDEGIVDINANVTFEGTLMVSSKGRLIIRAGDTLTVGATTFANGSFVDIEAGGVLIINGNLTNNNNSTGINVNGQIFVNGNVTGGNGSAITGTGGLAATGTIVTSGSGSIFGSTTNCLTPPCTSGNSTLPIELLSFEGFSMDNLLEIRWITASEINNDYFSLERSSDARKFDVIATVDGCGNCSYTNEYSFEDFSAGEGENYYRLKQTDFNGEFTYSKIIAVHRKAESGLMANIFPNPFRNSTTIQLNKVYNDIQISIYDLKGVIKYEKQFVETYGMEIDLSFLGAGFYNILIRSEKDLFQQRLIKL